MKQKMFPPTPALLGWLIFSLFLGVVAIRHELGHLESQAWNIVRSAGSLSELLASVGNEGHSPLGYMLVWPLSLFGKPELMQLIGWCVGALLAWQLLRDRPFPYPLILVVLFGYFFVYEYTVVPRAYLLAVLGISLLASSIYQRQGSLLYHVILCCLVAGSSAFGLILSGALMLVVFTLYWAPAQLDGHSFMPRLWWQSFCQRPKRESVLALALYVSVAIITAWAIINPSEQSSFEQSLSSGDTLKPGKLALTVITPVFPHVTTLPVVGSLWFGSKGIGITVLLCLALGVILSVAILFRRWPPVLLAWLSGCALIMAVAWYTGFIAERLLGHVVLLAVFLFWVRPALPGYQSGKPAGIDKLAAFAVVCTVLYQAAIGIAVASVDIIRPATGYKELAAEVRSFMREPYDLVVAESIYQSALIAYLDHDAFDLNCLCVTRFAEWERLKKRGQIIPMKRNWCASQYDAELSIQDRRPVLAVLEKDYPFDLSDMSLVTTVPRGFAYPGEPDYNLWLWPEPDCSVDSDSDSDSSLSSGGSPNIDEREQ